MLMGEDITVHDFKDKLFDGKGILYYLNDMILNMILSYHNMEDNFSHGSRDFMNNTDTLKSDKNGKNFKYNIHKAHINELHRFDVGFLFMAEILKNKTLNLYLENLYSYTDFS
jgi:hypothetical protein